MIYDCCPALKLGTLRDNSVTSSSHQEGLILLLSYFLWCLIVFRIDVAFCRSEQVMLVIDSINVVCNGTCIAQLVLILIVEMELALGRGLVYMTATVWF